MDQVHALSNLSIGREALPAAAAHPLQRHWPAYRLRCRSCQSQRNLAVLSHIRHRQQLGQRCSLPQGTDCSASRLASKEAPSSLPGNVGN